LYKKSPLTIDQILAWADAHHRRTGRWPSSISGSVYGQRQQTWLAVDLCLRLGFRGLPGGSSLARLFQKHRGVWGRRNKPPLTIAKIRRLAKKYCHLTDKWPNASSGPIPGKIPDYWKSIDYYLRNGGRGLPGGTSLVEVLYDFRGRAGRPPLTLSQVLAWADLHYKRTGRRPTVSSGPVIGAKEETWMAIDRALRRGGRGLPPGSSLSRLLKKERGVHCRKHRS
jgi:hypothetical protein